MELRHLKYFMKGGTAAFFQSRRRARHSAVGAEPAWHEGDSFAGRCGVGLSRILQRSFLHICPTSPIFLFLQSGRKNRARIWRGFSLSEIFCIFNFSPFFPFFSGLASKRWAETCGKNINGIFGVFSFFILLPLLILSCTCRIHSPCTLRGS